MILRVQLWLKWLLLLLLLRQLRLQLISLRLGMRQHRVHCHRPLRPRLLWRLLWRL